MEYKITESQYKRLSEISVGSGKISFSDSYKDIFSNVWNNTSHEKIKKLVYAYFKEILGLKLSKIELNTVVDELRWIEPKHLPKKTRNKDVLPSLAYYLIKNLYGLKKMGNLEVWKNKSSDSFFGDTEYVFFDPELEISIGRITGEKNISNKMKFWSISTSSVDKGLIGRGYGKEMYLALLDDVKILSSDRTLYGDSLNIWVNVLPKYVPVYAEINDGVFDKFVKIGPRTNLLKHDKVERYYATKNEKDFQKYLD